MTKKKRQKLEAFIMEIDEFSSSPSWICAVTILKVLLRETRFNERGMFSLSHRSRFPSDGIWTTLLTNQQGLHLKLIPQKQIHNQSVVKIAKQEIDRGWATKLASDKWGNNKLLFYIEKKNK